MSTLLPLLLLVPALLPSARAAQVGNPVATPDQGRFSVEAILDGQRTLVTDTQCTSDGCDAIRNPIETGGRVGVDLLHGVGLFADGGWIQETIREADFYAQGWVARGGVRLAIPVRDAWHAALVVSGETGRTAWEPAADSTEKQTEGTWQGIEAAGLLAFAPDDGSIFFYAGPVALPWFREQVDILTDDVGYFLAPAQAVGGVSGVELRSDHLGLPWTGGQVRFSLGTELRYQGGWGATASARLSF